MCEEVNYQIFQATSKPLYGTELFRLLGSGVARLFCHAWALDGQATQP